MNAYHDNKDYVNFFIDETFQFSKEHKSTKYYTQLDNIFIFFQEICFNIHQKKIREVELYEYLFARHSSSRIEGLSHITALDHGQ